MLLGHAYPSYQVNFTNGQMCSRPALSQCWRENEHFMKVLATQNDLLKPQGKAIFKYPSVEAPQLECFVEVHLAG